METPRVLSANSHAPRPEICVLAKSVSISSRCSHAQLAFVAAFCWLDHVAFLPASHIMAFQLDWDPFENLYGLGMNMSPRLVSETP